MVKKSSNAKKEKPQEKNTGLLNVVKNGAAFVLKNTTGKIPPIILVIFLLGAIGYYFKNQFIVATVNNQPIWRFTLIKEIEKQAAKSTLESLITETLILQEAKKDNIEISDEELNEELKKIEENLKQQGQELDKLLAAQGMTKEKLKEQIGIQKIVEKIVGKDIEITDEEVDAFLEANEGFVPEDQDVEEAKPGIKEQLKQQKMGEKVREWLDALRKKAKINYFRFAPTE